jgi:hypothetical protein
MHPAEQLRDKAMELCAVNRVAEAHALLEAAFSLVAMQASELPVVCTIGAAEQLPLRLVSPAHALVQIRRGSIRIALRDGVELTPAVGLTAFTMLTRLFAGIAARRQDDSAHCIVVNLSDGCEVEGDYRRVSFSCSRSDSILVPDHHFANSDNYASLRQTVARTALPWTQRRDLVFWRGAGVGRYLRAPEGTPRPWGSHQRLELCHRARESAHRGRLDVGVVDHAGILDDSGKRMVEAAGFIKPYVAKERFLDFRYQIDIDGWSNSWVLMERLIMGATVVKVNSAFGYRQWYYDRLVPWVHYVPVRADFADFDETLDWLFTHPDESEQIAANGRDLAAGMRLDQEMAEAEGRIEAALQPQ